MRILFFSEDFLPTARPGGVAWAAPPHYRCELPCEALRTLGGHAATLVPRLVAAPTSGVLVGVTPDGRAIDDADVVVLQGFIPADVVYAARRAGQIVIADLTDTFEVPERHPYSSLVEAVRPATTAMYLACDAITVSSQYLVRYLHELPDCPEVHLLRNPIALQEWGSPEDVTDGPVLGWCGSLLERADDLSVLRPWLGTFLEQHDLRFIHVGDGPIGVPGMVADAISFAEAATIDPARVEGRPLRTFPEYLETRPWRGIDIQLVPLMDHPYSLGKSCLKGLESAAQGIPYVASPQAEYQWLGCDSLAGSDISDQPPEAWVEALESMLDPSERIRVRTEARRRVEREDIARRWREWEDCYSTLFQR